MRFEYTREQRELLNNFVNSGGRFHHIYERDRRGLPTVVTTIAYRRRPDGMVEYAAATWHRDISYIPQAFYRQENIAHVLVRFYGSPVVVPDTTEQLRQRAKDYMEGLAADLQTDVLTLGRLNRRFNFLAESPAAWQSAWWTNTLGRYGHTGAGLKRIQARQTAESLA